MNIGQIARNQRMLYNFMNRSGSSGYASTSASSMLSSWSASQPPSKVSAYSGMLNGWGVGSSAGDDESNFFSSPAALQGTVRQIAKRLYDASFSSDSIAQENAASITRGALAANGDPALQAIQEKLGAKVDSLQQLYRPDQTLSDAFAQRQAVAEELVSRLQTVSLSDETTKRIQELALRDAKNSAGAQEDGEKAQDTSGLAQKDRLSMIREEVQKFAPSKRAAAFNTINKVWENELDRIGAYIKEKDPNWTAWGDEFDASILDDYKAGVNMWA